MMAQSQLNPITVPTCLIFKIVINQFHFKFLAKQDHNQDTDL